MYSGTWCDARKNLLEWRSELRTIRSCTGNYKEWLGQRADKKIQETLKAAFTF